MRSLGSDACAALINSGANHSSQLSLTHVIATNRGRTINTSAAPARNQRRRRMRYSLVIIVFYNPLQRSIRLSRSNICFGGAQKKKRRQEGQESSRCVTIAPRQHHGH